MIRRLARLRTSIAAGISPTLGILAQHDPHPLFVPAWYLRSAAPDPAPRITVVTPSLDQGGFIARTVESVLAQDYPNLDYVIRDGGSSDDTMARLERYRPRLGAVHSAPDGGQGAAINAGFAATHGELMCWLNADDVLLPGSLAYVARYFARHPKVDVLYGNRVVIDEFDREVGTWVLPPHHPESIRWVDFIPQECTFWRRSLWDRCGPLDEDLHFALDWDLWRRFEAGGARFAHTRRFLAAFRRHGDQKTNFDAGEALPERAFSEIERVGERWNGIAVTIQEAHLRSQPYRLRAVPARIRERALDQVRQPRVPVYFPP